MAALKNLVHLLLLFSIIFCQGKQDGWELVSAEREFSISGIVPLTAGMLVVHDNKRKGQARIGLVSWNSYEYNQLDWPSDELPYDLEALDLLPGKKNEMIAMESSGKCYHVYYDRGRKKLVFKKEFQIPEVMRPMNLEGIAFYKVGRKTLAAWGDRGSDKLPGTLHWGWLTSYGTKIEPLGSFSFSVPFPKQDVRHLSDVEITEDGVCWISSGSDPGDDGPFDSAVYILGTFKIEEQSVVFDPAELGQSILKFPGHKIEAITGFARSLIYGTDDENFGASVWFNPPK